MLSKNMVTKLNNQINLENYSSNIYLQMSAWAEIKGLDGSAAFLRQQAREELDHMHRLFQYVHETGALPVLGAIKAPATEFESISEMFKQVLEHEKLVTAKINELMDAAIKEKDHSTVNFLQWYVAEQHEEEHTIQQVLDKIQNIGEAGSGVYFIDRAIGGMVHKN
ncbi:ferritin [Syntrophotalea acetylenivorans]|uniref:Ferritin n=1 Tax=Syntrophotalea acetylenivorans TaxID=1842532 RepID=A0A1L3GNA2_9BACT|nr:non-heme ferritin [Syntrophotalea acetylenivorans]APG27391.1 ferritin [Syntrophotalea acetylenivorans]